MKEYEQKIHNIINNAEEDVICQANQAYKDGFNDGYVEGYDHGKQDGYEEGQKSLVKAYVIGKGETTLEDVKKAEYNRGLNDAWDAARKIAEDITDGGYSLDELREIFDETLDRIIFKRNTAAEAIAKIKEYEDEQKQDDWRDIPSEEMTLEQARRAVKELRAEVVGKILAEEQSNDE